jgi:hypothetical protein
MAQDAITVTGIERYQEALAKMQTDNPRTRKELQRIIRKAIGEARKNVVKDAKDVLENDPRHAYKAVRNSVYKQILGGQINILSSRHRGAPTKYEPKRTLQEGQRGGNRRKRSAETMRYMSYEGADRGFILRFLNAGTADRGVEFAYNESRKVDRWNKHPNTGNRGRIRARGFFATSSHQAMRKAADELTKLIDNLIKQETR